MLTPLAAELVNQFVPHQVHRRFCLVNRGFHRFQRRANLSVPSPALYDEFTAFDLKAQNCGIGHQTQKVDLPSLATTGWQRTDFVHYDPAFGGGIFTEQPKNQLLRSGGVVRNAGRYHGSHS